MNRRDPVGSAVLAVLSECGEMQNFAIVAALEGYTMRQVDAALQRLRRAGEIESLPRIRGVRPFALWRRTPTGGRDA